MPYISNEYRNLTIWVPESGDYGEATLDDYIAHIQATIKDLPLHKRYGVTNYTISRIVAGSLKPSTNHQYDWNYDTLSHARAVLVDAADEFYDRLMRPYEDQAKDKNGDIPEYKSEHRMRTTLT